MAVLDGPMGQLASQLLGTFGRPATLVRGGAGTYSPEQGRTMAVEAAASFACHVVFAEFAVSQLDGTVVRLGDRKAIVSRLALGTEPRPSSDTLTVDGVTWRIVRVEGYSSGEQEAAYSLHVRR